MPGRLIREGLLDSERYWSVSIEARELFVHLALLADDFGCLSMAPTFIGRRCFESRPTTEKLARLVAQLVDADLVRQYQSNGLTFAFIPRFGQRLRRFTLKHPRPPIEVLSGDERAIKLFSIINAQNQALPDREPTDAGHPAAEEKGSRKEEKGSEVNAAVDNFTKPVIRTNVKPDLEMIQGKTYSQWLKDLNIQIQPSWTGADAKLAVDKALKVGST